MGKPFWRSVEYFFTGNYSADNGNNNIVAIGFGGEIHAYGGDDHVTLGSIGATVHTGSGNDTVVGGAAYMRIEDSSGDLSVKGAAGYADINKSGDGHLSFAGAAGGVTMDHTGSHGNLRYGGVAAYNGLTRKGKTGNVTFEGAGGYNSLWHETNQGNLYYAGAGAGNKLDRTWFDRYQGSTGNVSFNGAGAANSISSRVESGHITFKGAGADNHLVRKGKYGNISLQGAGASNRIERVRQADDVYVETHGDIRFEGVGGYNRLYSDVAHGDIRYSGAGAYNEITRKGAGNDIDGEGLRFADASDIVLSNATLGGSWIAESQQVSGVKYSREPNTYLFAFADETYTKISKVQLRNDPQTGELKYYATSWYKEGNLLDGLASRDISSGGGFTEVNINGAYTLSNLTVEKQQSVTVHAVEENLTEYEWVTYANGAIIDADNISLSDAKLSGSAIYQDGTKVDVKAVKSNRNPNTYIYAKKFSVHTKIVVVELANDPETGVLKYQAKAWYKEGDHTADLANQDISAANGYSAMGKGGYSLSDLHYSVNAVRSTSERVADLDEYTENTLIKPSTDSGESSGDVHFNGAGGGNVIKSNVTRGNVYFNGGGIANVILHHSRFGDTEFNGGGAANVIVKSGEQGDLRFRGAGLANVLVHQSQQGKMDVYAGGAVNVLVRIGDGEYLAHLLAYGNISVHKGSGKSRVVMLGGYNTHTQVGDGNGVWLGAGGFNVMTQVGRGNLASVLVGGANVLTKIGDGDLTSGMVGGANIITHVSSDSASSNTTSVALGGANILTKKGKGNTLAVMGGGANVLTHVGDGNTTGIMVGGANILTKVGDGDTTGVMLGIGNVLTHVGDGQTLGVMGAVGNIFTKVGDGTSIAAMIGGGNIFTHVGEGDAWALMGGLGNVFTKVGDGNALALMVAAANVYTHVGDGMSVALMVARGNIATKVGNGMMLAAMVGDANILTHVGDGNTFAAMIGQANVLTKVGDDLTAALMLGRANIYTHVGDGTSIGLFAGEVNVMTKVGDGTTLAAMFGRANIMTHVGDGLTGVLALGEANIVTKVGDDFMGVVAAAKANVVTHVGDSTTAAVLAGKGNILTKVGNGTTVGLLISDIGNIMTHVGDGASIGFAKGKANIITKVGDGLGINAAWGKANIFTHVGDGDRYNFAKGDANIITKVGDGQEVAVVHGKANIITHVGDGDDYTGAWGKANIITKVGDGRSVVLAKGDANIVTQVGDGDGYNALWSKANIVTKVGDGIQVTAAKGKANITTTVGDGLNVTAAYGDANINTKVGDGVSVSLAWGKYNINTKVGDGLNVAVMKGKANVNVHVGDGMGINASYARNNVAIKVGNGDFYSLAVASSNTKSNKLSSLFETIKQTVLGVGGSQAINYLVQGNDASSSGSQKGRGAIATPEVTRLEGFQMDEIDEIGSDLGDSLSAGVTDVETPDLGKMQDELNVDSSDESPSQNPNLIANGGFEQGEQGWSSTHGVEADFTAGAYGVSDEGHGSRVSELDTYTNTSIYQDISNLSDGEVIALSFDFARRAGISSNEGIEVLWNGEPVFSSSGDDTSWQQKTLKLTAQGGSNRIEFKGTGQSDGLGYVLDNVVARAEKSQQASAVSDNAQQNQATQNAMSDKERAEADRQRLEQEREQQLAAVSGTQSQLEATDQQALETNGQAQREAVKQESDEVTAELTAMAQGLDALDEHAQYQGASGNGWREHFAGNLLDDVQDRVEDAKAESGEHLSDAQRTYSDNQQDVKDAVAKSEAGVAKGEQNQAGAQRDIDKAEADAEVRKSEALSSQQDAQRAQEQANSASSDAESRGESDASAANNKANQAKSDAKGAKQNEGDKPNRRGASGSGLSGEAHEVRGAGDTSSHINAEGLVQADGRYSEGLQEDELQALEGATQAVNRLQINAGVRNSNTGSAIVSMFTDAPATTPATHIGDGGLTRGRDVARQEISLSGVNLQGLGEAAVDHSAGFNFSLLAKSDTRFTESTQRYLGWLSTDLPSKALRAVRRGVQRVQKNPSEETLVALEGALQQWQDKHPKEFEQRSEQVQSLRTEMTALESHIQTSRAKSEGVLGLAIAPKATQDFGSKVIFDGIGRILGLTESLTPDEVSRLKAQEVISLTQKNSSAKRDTAKTESESLIEFAYKLGLTDSPETKQLADKAKALWMSGNVTQDTAKALFSEAHEQLTAHPELQTLAAQLLADAQKEKATGQYIDNLFGRRFDSEIAHELVKNTTAQAVDTSVAIGTHIVNDFDAWIDTLMLDEAQRRERVQNKMEAFAKAIAKDTRPWFSRVPTLTQFLDNPNYDNFKTMMTQVDDGFDVIKVPFLTVKMAITSGMGMDMTPWKTKGDRFYQNVITKARSTSNKVSPGVEGNRVVTLKERNTSGYGTGLHYQPSGDHYEDFGEGRSVADGRILTPGKETTFENNALNKGLSVVSGASGSTNIMVHLNQYLASKDPTFSAEQAYLNTLAFLVFDGGHSVNESLTVYKALQASDSDRLSVMENYTADYEDLVRIANGESGQNALRSALENAYEKTLSFYREHGYSGSGELEALGPKFKGKGPKLTLEVPKEAPAPQPAATHLIQNWQQIVADMKASEPAEVSAFESAPDYSEFQNIGAFGHLSVNGFELSNPGDNVFMHATRTENNEKGFDGDKLHISVDAAHIEQAYEVLKPLLFSQHSPIDKWKVTDTASSANAQSRVVQGAQFTLYIKTDSKTTGYEGKTIKQVQNLIQNIESRIAAAGIAPGAKPNSDVSADHWQFVSYRNEKRSDREGGAAQSARLRHEPFYQLVSASEPSDTPAGLGDSVSPVVNRHLSDWQQVAVIPKSNGGTTQFDGQLIIQTEDHPTVARAAANLAGKHPDSSVVVQLDADGNYRVVYGDPAKLNGKLRWQLVGHGRDGSASNNTTLGGHTATELATKLANFSQALSREHGASMNPAHISVVGCSLVSQDHQQGFGHGFIRAMAEQGILSSVSARTSELAVDNAGRKFTRNGQNEWKHKLQPTKVVLSWNEQDEVVTREEAIRNGVAEGDIEISRVGQAAEASKASGAIADNSEVFSAPEKRKNTQAVASSGAKSSNKLSYSGNIQVNVGDGEFTAVNWGTSNLGIKVGTGGFKSLAFGDNNVMVHIGDGDSKHSFDMAGYQALEGAQMFIGTRNVSFNMGRSNDLLVMMDKSIPTPPLVNPFDGAARISGVLTEIATSGDDGDWLAAQQAQWTLSGAKKYLADISGLDQSSSVDYTSLTDLDSHNERSSRGLKHDVEAALNKQYNQWLGSNDNDQSKGNKSRADKFREANDKLAFNFAVGGRGADIQVTTGSWNFMFGDNIQSILDTNLGSLFGLMTQQFSSTGQAKTTFTYNPQDLPRQLKNKLLGKMAGVGADTTLGDIFGVDYTAAGNVVSRQGEPVDGVAILTEMLEVIAEFGGDQLQAFTDPAKLLDGLKAGLDTGGDAITSFAESHGLKEKAPDEEEDASSVVVEQGESSAGVESVDAPEQQRAFGFNSLNLPNLFATIFSKDKQDEMKSLVTNLKQNLTADLLNMKEKTFDFLRNSGHLKGDGDLHVSLGNYNFNWGGDGKDLGAYLGDNNNFWGGRGDDVYYATGTSNVFTGGEGDDMGVLMGRENMMFGGEGNDTAVVAGRINHVFMGAGDDQSFVFGEGGEIDAGSGRDYVVTSGNFNRVDTGEDQDYAVTIGSNNRAELGGGDDFANVFGNYNRIDGSAGKDVIKLMGYSAVLNGGQDDDHLIAAAISKFSELDGGDGSDLIVLGGYENRFSGGAGVDSFVVNGDIIINTVSDISSEDKIVFDGLNWQNIWFERSGYDLSLSILRQPGSASDQEKFESVGNVVFSDYFKDNRAELVIDMSDKDTAGERDYLALSRSSVDALVQAMSGFAPQAGDTGLLSKLDNQSRLDVTAAWSDVVSNKGRIA